jgi:hypothetical protein
MSHVETQLPATDSAPALARAFIRETLGTWKLDGFGDVTELLTDELVSNVVRHVGSPSTLRIASERMTLRIEVADASTRLPVLQKPDPEAVSGHGIRLLDALATRWGADRHADGKTVWFEVDMGPPEAAANELHHF